MSADCCQHFDGFAYCKWPADGAMHHKPGVAHNIVPGRPEQGVRYEYHEFQEERDERQRINAVIPTLISQQPQRQDSLTAQLEDLRAVANLLGCYDAADWIAAYGLGQPKSPTPERTS